MPMQFRRSAILFVLGLALVESGFSRIDGVVSAFSPSLLAQSQSSERDFLSRIRRLTIDGRRAGEGYWSKDGKQLVFLSDRSGNENVWVAGRDGARPRQVSLFDDNSVYTYIFNDFF